MALAPTDTASCSGRNSQARTHAHVHRSNARKDVRFDRIQEHQRRVHVFVYAHVHVHMHVLSMCLCMHTCACVCVWPHHTCACVCVRQPPPPHTCMTAPHVCICMCVWQRVHGVHACTHARMHGMCISSWRVGRPAASGKDPCLFCAVSELAIARFLLCSTACNTLGWR